MNASQFYQLYGMFVEPLVLVAPDGRLVAANTAAQSLIGRKQPELAGFALWELTLEPPEKTKSLLNRFWSSGQFLPGAITLRNGTPNGVRCRVEGAQVRTGETAAVLLRLQHLDVSLTRFRTLNERITALHREILERQRVEQELFEQREWLRVTLSSIGDGVITTDVNANITFMNAVAESLTGCSAENAIGAPLEDVFRIISEDTRLPLETPAAKVLRRGTIADVAHHALLIASDGTEHPVADSGAPIHSPEGVLLGVVMVFRNITERRKDERLLKESNRSLQKKNENLRQFAYAVAHDLKEPMRIVSLYSQLMAQTFPEKLGPEGEMILSQVVQGASRMDALLKGLLALMTAGESAAKDREIVDSSTALSQALSNLQTAISESGAVITHDSMPQVKAHFASMVSLFQNLIGNAIKYRREDETVRVHVSASRIDRSWQFVVEDNGIGIAPEYYQQIFGVFKRLNPEQYPGTGIGLALCAQVVERYDGAIWVDSVPGAGSRFTFGIPDPGQEVAPPAISELV